MTGAQQAMGLPEEIPAAREPLGSPMRSKESATAPCDPRAALERKVLDVASNLLLASSIRMGSELGIFKEMARVPGKPFTVDEMASKLSLSSRYVGDLFLHLASNGMLDYSAGEQSDDQWTMSADHALILDPPMNEGVVPFLSALSEGHTKQFHLLKDAIKSDSGIAWSKMPCISSGARDFFAPIYRKLLPKWVAEVPQVSALMRRGRIADVECGFGVSTMTLAKIFPNAQLIGIDTDAESIDSAKRAAAKAEIPNVKFACADSRSWVEDTFSADAARAKSALTRPLSVMRSIFGKERKATARAPGPGKGPWALGRWGEYDIVLLFDAFHDMPDPASVAAECFRALRPGGAVLMVEPLSSINDDTASKLELSTTKLYSGLQVHFCTPCGKHGIKHGHRRVSEGIGPTAGTCRHRALMMAAGFSGFEQLLADDQGLDAPGPRGFRLFLATKPTGTK